MAISFIANTLKRAATIRNVLRQLLKTKKMKKVEIKNFSHAEVDAPKETWGFARIPIVHKLIRAEGEDLEVSDGYHTFDELYDHRITLYIALCKVLKENGMNVWRSTLHSDLTQFDGWFILGINDKPGKQITYHIPMERWEETNFAWSIGHAPIFDGHTSEDVLKRLKEI